MNLVMEFGKYTEVTTLAKKVNPEMFENLHRIFVCPDARNFWLARIVKDTNEDYDHQEGKWMLERNLVEFDDLPFGKDKTVKNVKALLKDDSGDNFDCYECDSEEEALEKISDTFGIYLEDGTLKVVE